MKKLIVTLTVIFSGIACMAQDVSMTDRDSVKTETPREKRKKRERKFDYKLGGWLETRFIYNSYASKSPREQVLYYYPLAPDYGSDGRDINKSGRLSFSAFSSRLSFGIDNIKVGRASIGTYMEGDFLGSSDAFNHMLRLRHAYIDIAWSGNNFRIGQTNHLTSPEKMFPATVMFNAGVPFATLNRGPQIRYTHTFKHNINLSVAAEYYTSHRAIGPENAQMNAAIPDIHAKVEFGDPGKIMGGITGGYKFLKPRTEDSEGNRSSTIVPSFDINAFLSFTLNDYKFKLWGIYGQNLTPYGIIGGYGKLLEESPYGDYRYGNIYGMSAWFDFTTPRYGDFDFGFFAGYQANLGSKKEIDPEIGYYRDCNLQWFNRLSPRIYYYMGKHLKFGLEYTYSSAQWMSVSDNKFKSIDNYDITGNHRVEFLARFIF